MLIKYKDTVINLDLVTDFGNNSDNERSLIFYHPFMVNPEYYGNSVLVFKSKEERDKAYKHILYSYKIDCRVCDLE